MYIYIYKKTFTDTQYVIGKHFNKVQDIRVTIILVGRGVHGCVRACADLRLSARNVNENASRRYEWRRVCKKITVSKKERQMYNNYLGTYTHTDPRVAILFPD